MARNKEIEIETRLGRRSVDAEKVVHFPRGLAGFENERDFILLQIRPEAPLLILQSTSNPVVGLLVADPYSFMDKTAYAPALGEAEKQLLQIADTEETADRMISKMLRLRIFADADGKTTTMCVPLPPSDAVPHRIYLRTRF